jgi:DNA-binding MarR family transcriptional regulator/GNAT superfamily N-acetyltransferase
VISIRFHRIVQLADSRDHGRATGQAKTVKPFLWGNCALAGPTISDYSQIMADDDIQRIRAFNRTVTRRLGVLNDRYLGRNRPLVESRLLFEIGPEGTSVRDLRARLGLDSGFLSRLLRKLERKGLARTSRRAADDARVRFASLTKSGLVELRRINALSDNLAKSMLGTLTREQSIRLVESMSQVERLLRSSSVEVTRTEPSSADATHCFAQYVAELSVRFREGFSRNAAGWSDADECDFLPPKGCLLVASLFGEPVGCGALRTLGPGVGEIKRMWVAPSARGLGIARRVLRELERVAKQRRLRAIRLDTNEALTEAQQLYRSSGYREIERFNDNPYADYWLEKTLL